MNANLKAAIVAFTVGLLLLGVVGEYSMGYVAAIAIPMGFFEFFGHDSALPQILLAIFNGLLGFGVLGFIAGLTYSQLSSAWVRNSFICLIGFLFYLSVGAWLVHGNSIENPLAGISQGFNVVSFLVLLLCLFGSSFWVSMNAAGRDLKAQ